MARGGTAARVRTRRAAAPRGSANVATDREVGVVAAVLVAGSKKAAAHHVGLSHSTVQAPPGERAVEGGGGGDDRATRVDPVPAVA